MKATAIASLIVAVVAGANAASPDSPVELPFVATLVVVEGSEAPIARVTVRNVSARPVDVAVHPAIKLKARSSKQGATAIEYWAPVGFSGQSYGPNEPQHLVLEPRQEKMLSVGLGQLQWARVRSSEWPRRSLANTVAPGEYDVWYEVQLALEPPSLVASEPVVVRLP